MLLVHCISFLGGPLLLQPAWQLLFCSSLRLLSIALLPPWLSSSLLRSLLLQLSQCPLPCLPQSHISWAFLRWDQRRDLKILTTARWNLPPFSSLVLFIHAQPQALGPLNLQSSGPWGQARGASQFTSILCQLMRETTASSCCQAPALQGEKGGGPDWEEEAFVLGPFSGVSRERPLVLFPGISREKSALILTLWNSHPFSVVFIHLESSALGWHWSFWTWGSRNLRSESQLYKETSVLPHKAPALHRVPLMGERQLRTHEPWSRAGASYTHRMSVHWH